MLCVGTQWLVKEGRQHIATNILDKVKEIRVDSSKPMPQCTPAWFTSRLHSTCIEWSNRTASISATQTNALRSLARYMRTSGDIGASPRAQFGYADSEALPTVYDKVFAVQIANELEAIAKSLQGIQKESDDFLARYKQTADTLTEHAKRAQKLAQLSNSGSVPREDSDDSDSGPDRRKAKGTVKKAKERERDEVDDLAAFLRPKLPDGSRQGCWGHRVYYNATRDHMLRNCNKLEKVIASAVADGFKRRSRRDGGK